MAASVKYLRLFAYLAQMGWWMCPNQSERCVLRADLSAQTSCLPQSNYPNALRSCSFSPFVALCFHISGTLEHCRTDETALMNNNCKNADGAHKDARGDISEPRLWVMNRQPCYHVCGYAGVGVWAHPRAKREMERVGRTDGDFKPDELLEVPVFVAFTPSPPAMLGGNESSGGFLRDGKRV